MPPLPVVSGRTLIAFMGSLGYVVMRQRGSHVRLELRNDRGTWTETIPLHREVARGTLRGILKRLMQATEIELDELVARLAEF